MNLLNYLKHEHTFPDLKPSWNAATQVIPRWEGPHHLIKSFNSLKNPSQVYSFQKFHSNQMDRSPLFVQLLIIPFLYTCNTSLHSELLRILSKSHTPCAIHILYFILLRCTSAKLLILYKMLATLYFNLCIMNCSLQNHLFALITQHCSNSTYC